MFQLLPVFLGLFDSTVQKLMNGFRDIFYELAYSNLSNMLSDLNEKVATISTELSTAPDAWQGGTIWELIVKIAEQVALPVAGTVFTFVVLWELISMLVQPNNLADIDFVSVLMKWLIKTIVAAWFISNALTICNCFFGIGASMVMGFESDVDLTIDVDSAIRMSIEPAWKKNFQKQQRIRLAIYKKLFGIRILSNVERS